MVNEKQKQIKRLEEGRCMYCGNKDKPIKSGYCEDCVNRKVWDVAEKHDDGSLTLKVPDKDLKDKDD